MKQLRLYIATLALATTACTAFTACSDDTENFDNHIYVDGQTQTTTVLFKSTIKTGTGTFKVAMARPADQDIHVTVKTDASLVSTYNATFYQQAEALPEGSYKLVTDQTVIKAGGVSSDNLELSFSGLDQLDKEKIYVLPVTIAQSDLSPLSHDNTMYYVFKGASLINTVPDMTKNLVYVKWNNPSVADNLRQLTAEALVRANKFDKMLTSVMGIEDYFLIRIGDAGIPQNRLQIAWHQGNLTSEDLDMPTNEWVHIAVTYDADADGKIIIYLNGKNVLEGNKNLGGINWAQTMTDEGNGFWIGHSYNRERYFDGNISEVRIWNRVLCSDEINAKDHFYEVAADSEGLVSYWRFDEGAGTAIKDHTGNGNDATAVEALTWNAVELPAK